MKEPRAVMGQNRRAPEHRADLEHARHVRDDRHLLVELRALRQAPLPAHVVQAEHLRTTPT